MFYMQDTKQAADHGTSGGSPSEEEDGLDDDD